MKKQLLDHQSIDEDNDDNKNKRSFKNAQFLSNAQTLKHLKSLQGECKIQGIILLEISYLKICIWILPIVFSVVGLLLIKYFMKLRKMAFYSQLQFEEVYKKGSHVYISGSGHEIIVNIKRIHSDNPQLERLIFKFKELSYQIHPKLEIVLPIGIDFKEELQMYLLNQNNKKDGIKQSQIIARRQFLGKNEHNVEIPNYLEFIFQTMTQPFFIVQYLVTIIYIVQGSIIFSINMLIFSFITTTINYFLLRRSYNKIKQIAEKTYPIQVLRNKEEKSILNIELVPGDIYKPHKEVPCDSIILEGELFANEVSLTGENVPIGKFKINSKEELSNQKCWIYEGSTVLSIKPNTYAMAVHTGFGSRKGRIIRKILTKIPKSPEFFLTLIFFLLQISAVAVVLYLSTVYLMLQKSIDTILVVFRFFDFLTFSFSSVFPLFFNLAYSFSLIRLNKKQILGTEAEKTVEGARIETMCFDKTGTLTINQVKVSQIFGVKSNEKTAKVENITGEFHEKENILLKKIFSTCHSVKRIDEVLLGDEIDLKMFLHSKFEMKEEDEDVETIFKVTSTEKGAKQGELKVIKINQYESKFQSMSVLVRDISDNKFYAFCKGAPELIQKYARNKPENYQQLLKQLSLEGFRCIAFGFKEISVQNVEKLKFSESREQFLKDNQLLGLVSFENSLKEQAPEMIQKLKLGNIEAKIITGDNIYIGVQTAKEARIIEENEKVLVVEGKEFFNEKYQATLISFNNNKVSEQRIQISNIHDESISPDWAIALDNTYIEKNPNDFLSKKCRIFARISPENKAKIVREHKQIINEQFKNRTRFQKWFGPCRKKVGMVGDGANDLIAIREADIGIGISSSDAVYGSSFSVNNLNQIEDLILQGKNTERQIIQIVQYFCTIQYLHIPINILLSLDSTNEADLQSIYQNFASKLIITLFFVLSRPNTQICKYCPASNFMGLENQLIFWVNTCIYTAGFIFGFFYYQNTSDYTSNPNPTATFASGYYTKTKSGTIMFLMMMLSYNWLCIFIFRSSPWKERIWKNIPLFLLILLNIIASTLFFFITKYLSFLNFVQIDIKDSIIVLVITAVSIFVSWIFTLIIQNIKLHEKQDDFLRSSEIQNENSIKEDKRTTEVENL